jgi:2-iminobutanoate/2-iminopropanoate deaminase
MSAPSIEGIRLEPDRFGAYGYSPAVAFGDLLFVSGQSAVDDAGTTVGVGDFGAQVRQTFANLDRALRAGGSDLSQVVKVTGFLTDMAHLPELVAARRQYFGEPFPADSVVEVTALSRPELLIEIEAIAIRRPAVDHGRPPSRS